MMTIGRRVMFYFGKRHGSFVTKSALVQAISDDRKRVKLLYLDKGTSVQKWVHKSRVREE